MVVVKERRMTYDQSGDVNAGIGDADSDLRDAENLISRHEILQDQHRHSLKEAGRFCFRINHFLPYIIHWINYK